MNTKTKVEHTKGEWTANNYLNEASIYCPSKKRGIAKLKFADFNYSEEEVKANAKLIAAAPDLLEAITYYESGINHFYNCINFGKSFLDANAIEFMSNHSIKFRAAIKKATE